MNFQNKGVAGYSKTFYTTPNKSGPDWSAVPAWLWFLLALSVTMATFSLL